MMNPIPYAGINMTIKPPTAARPYPFKTKCHVIAMITVLFGQGLAMATLDASKGGIQLWTAPSTNRVYLTQQPDTNAPQDIHISACRNEWESAQVVATGTPQQLAKLAFSLRQPVRKDGNTLPVATIFWEYDIPVKVSSPDAPLEAGLYPDVLVPFVNGDSANPSAFRKQSDRINFRLWIDFKIPATQSPGVYRCQCSATDTASKSEVASVEIVIEVHPAVLPRKPSLRSSFGIDEHRVARVHHLDREKDSAVLAKTMDTYYQLMADNRIEPSLIFGTSPPIRDDGQLGWELSSALNMPAPKELIQQYFNKNSFQTIHLPMWEDYPFTNPLGRDRDETVSYLAELARLSHRAAPDAKLFFAVGSLDEPESSSAYSSIRQWSKLVDEASSLAKVDINFFVTEQPTPQQKSWGSLADSVDVWAPHVMWIWEDLESPSGKREIAKRIAAGDQVWTYAALCQFRECWMKEKGMPDMAKDSYPPVWLTDYPAIHYRILPWICAVHGLTGIHYWSAFAWPDDVDPWRDAGTFLTQGATFNGDGLLIYPPRSLADSKTPCSSIRLKWIRDGMEDYDHLEILKKSDPATAAKILSSVARGFGDWEVSPSKLVEARCAISNALTFQP